MSAVAGPGAESSDLPAKQVLLQSWRRAWSGLGAQPEPGLFDEMLDRYRESHRRYHSLQHLQACIERLAPVLSLAAHPGEVEIALWFHDAVYELHRQDNEARSADLAAQALEAAGVPTEIVDRVNALTMATRHAGLPATPDEWLLVDVDLSILGAEAPRFDEYERQIRAEYGWVPEAIFRCRRRDLLRSFIARPFIYGTEHFRDRYEARARENIGRAIARLDDGGA